MEKIKVYIVDDHPIVTKGLSQVINQEEDLECCGISSDTHSLISEIEASSPDVVIVDVTLKEINGIDLIKGIKERFPKLVFLVLSMHDETIYAERALKAGARGYIMKKEASEKIILAIKTVMEGKVYLSDKMTSVLLDKFMGQTPVASQSPVEKFTNRELEIFQLISQGFKPSAIAEKLNLSVKTIETYRDHLKKKLNLKNAAELIRYAIEWQNKNRD